MKNNHIIAASALMLASAAALTSCQSEEDFDVKPAGGEVHLTLTANRAEVNSRTSFEQSEGNLITNWNEGDRLVVTDEAGTNLGVLTITDGQNTPDGVFEGNVTLGDLEYVNVIYLGSAYEGNLAEASGKIVFDISQQDGSFASLTNWDYLYQTTEVTKINGTEATASVEMVRSLAHGYFNLDLPNGVTLSAGDAVTITAAEGFYSQRTLNLKGLGISHQATANTVTVTMAEDGNDFYLTVIPQAFAPKFTVVKDGVTYTASLPSRTWKPAEYVRADVNNAPVQISDWSFEAAGEADHSKNPLAKWAESDLVYDKTSKSSHLAESYTVQGSLYQWGRNTGWSDYKDALGEFNTSNYTYGYGTYNKSFATGTGMTYGYDHASLRYTTAANIQNNPSKYFMHHSGTDYWISSFGDGGNTWEERAAKCGFTTSVCPEGYRLPTKEEFLQIKPTSALKGSGSLSSVINNLVELRSIEGECTYAIRWSAETKSSKTYLKIEALVVPDSFKEENLASVNWSDENVVTRYFGANGFIHGFYHENVVSTGQIFPVARPMPGVETHTDRLATSGNNFTVCWDYIKDYSVNNEGYYWMSDEKTAFTFQDNTRVKVVSAFSSRQSVLGTLPVNPQDCCSIRCVRK